MSLLRAKLPPNAKMRLNTRLLPVLTLVSAVLFLISPYRGFTVLLIGLGGLWLIALPWRSTPR